MLNYIRQYLVVVVIKIDCKKTRPVIQLFLTIIGVFLFDLYIYDAFRTATLASSPALKYTIRILFIIISLFIIGIMVAMEMGYISRHTPWFRNIIAPAILMIVLAKIVIFLLLLIEDGTRIVRWIVSYYQRQQHPTRWASRATFVNQLAIIAGIFPAATFLHGMLRNTYNYKVRNVNIALPNLPDVFKGFKILQISDIHIGSLSDRDKVKRGIDLINAQEADVVMFTGDLVNAKADEMDSQWINIFKEIKSKHGVFSSLGNHDYGDYVRWASTSEKMQNRNNIKDLHKKMGWRLLLNEFETIEKEGSKLAVIGVENWSSKPYFPKYGDLNRACTGCGDADVKILLSHDPTHWDGEVRTQKPDIDLTLSGHTHGMQFGIEIGSLRWSPAQYVYKQWAGLYQEGKQYLYVNRGFGVLGYKGRVGVMPEITVITLEKGDTKTA